MVKKAKKEGNSEQPTKHSGTKCVEKVQKKYLGYLTPKQNQPYLCHSCQRYDRTLIHSSFKDLEYCPLYDFPGKPISMLP